MSQILTSFDCFQRLPTELRDEIWRCSAEYPRFLEIVVLNNSPRQSKRNTLDDNGFVYFKNPFDFEAQLPAGLMVCRDSREAILRLFSGFDLGVRCVNRVLDIEYMWMDAAIPGPQILDKTRVLFNPDWDIVVLEIGHVLYKTGVLQTKISSQLQRMKFTRNSQKSHVQKLATTYFPWDESPGLPCNAGDVLETFHNLSTLFVVGHRGAACPCGHCPPPPPIGNDPDTVKKEVVETLRRTIQNRIGESEELQRVKQPKVKTYPTNHKSFGDYDVQRPWYGFIAPRNVFIDAQRSYLSSSSDSYLKEWKQWGLLRR